MFTHLTGKIIVIHLDFIRNHYLWKKQDVREIMLQREEALSVLNKTNKHLDFLQQNRLIYAFQKNIVKNKKYSRYVDWFLLAEKTKNQENKKEDFDEFRKDEIFIELMRKITKEYLPSEDFAYISEYKDLAAEVERYQKGLIEVVEIPCKNRAFSEDSNTLFLLNGVNSERERKRERKFA